MRVLRKEEEAQLFSAELLEELLDLDQLVALQLRAPARAESDRDARDGRRVRGLHDVHEVERPDRGPLVEDLRTELLGVTVDLAQPVRVRLQRLQALVGQRRQHQVERHCGSFPGGRAIVL